MKSSRLFAVVSFTALTACLEPSAPAGGVWSVSNVLLPAPSVVLGDTLRDSTGAAAPLRLVAFDRKGDTIPDVTPAFFVLDTGAVLTSAGFVLGDRMNTTGVRIVGSAGGLQTAPAVLHVSNTPDTIVATAAPDTLRALFGGDTALAANRSQALAVAVRNAAGAPARGFIVRYTIVSTPAGIPGMPSPAYMADAQSRPRGADTTTAQGTAQRHLVLRFASLADGPFKAGTQPDSFVVEAAVSYRGAPVPGSPVRFVLPAIVRF